jgi:hypothetical protein
MCTPRAGSIDSTPPATTATTLRTVRANPAPMITGNGWYCVARARAARAVLSGDSATKITPSTERRSRNVVIARLSCGRDYDGALADGPAVSRRPHLLSANRASATLAWTGAPSRAAPARCRPRETCRPVIAARGRSASDSQQSRLNALGECPQRAHRVVASRRADGRRLQHSRSRVLPDATR